MNTDQLTDCNIECLADGSLRPSELLAQVSDEEATTDLVADYKEALGKVRYYHATDDAECWREEKAEREQWEKILKDLSDEMEKLGVPKPTE